MHEVDNTGADEPPTQQEPSASEDIPGETPTSEDHYKTKAKHHNTSWSVTTEYNKYYQKRKTILQSWK